MYFLHLSFLWDLGFFTGFCASFLFLFLPITVWTPVGYFTPLTSLFILCCFVYVLSYWFDVFPLRVHLLLSCFCFSHWSRSLWLIILRFWFSSFWFLLLSLLFTEYFSACKASHCNSVLRALHSVTCLFFLRLSIYVPYFYWGLFLWVLWTWIMLYNAGLRLYERCPAFLRCIICASCCFLVFLFFFFRA